MFYLKQSTATAVLIGPFLDDTDGKTAETALTVASIDVDLYKKSDTHPLTKTDITPAASGSANDMAHVANGFYSLELTSGNTDTLGRGMITANIAGALPVWHEFEVLPANVYDSLFGSDKLQVDLQEWSGVAPLALTSQLVQAQGNQLGAQAKADVNAEVDTALDTAIPGTPTANSINERVKAIDDKLPSGNLSDLTAVQVNAEVVDALATDTYAEPSAVPAATSSLKDKINWLFALARNKITQTATTQSLRNDADSGNIATSAQSDDGTTYTKSEWS